MPGLSPQYNPKDVEERLYRQWETAGYFHADADSSRAPYTIVIPPPNVTGILHMGHALNNTIQDILIRCKRMQGFNALWIPGTDHAGIATQNVVEKMLASEGKRRQDLGREAFVQRVWQWKEQYGNTIIYQLKRLGSSCDWRRSRFTMDEGLSDAVTEIFIELYNQGLIYRGSYIINWCPRCQTALSDEEAPRQETQGKLYSIKYPLMGHEGARGKGQGARVDWKSRAPCLLSPVPAFIEVATTRPETMLGDTAIAVHPKDKRYKALVGRFALLPLVNRKLPIIADERIDRSFGTGAVKVTPAHDPLDFQLGMKHDLKFIDVMTDDGHMAGHDEVPAAYRGLDRFECRSKLVVDLERERFLGKIEEYTHNVGHCYRCQTVIEPRLSPQWFVKMKPLAEPAIRAVKEGKIRFSPKRWTKVYLNWMENIQDWCISRQIWWGHRLPVWYCKNCTQGQGVGDEGQGKSTSHAPRPAPRSPDSRVIVTRQKPERCPSCGGSQLVQDEDVLDTWFSSWLWPFSTLGWPKKAPDLGYFYPTNTLVTAQEIIFFWVARMIMAGYFCMGKPPFTRVYIHGTVRDITGKKMSKSLGNIIDPLEIIDKYGTDALRYTLVTATAIGQDIFLSEERFVAGRNFANKLWNATRFVLAQVTDGQCSVVSEKERPSTSHRSLVTDRRSVPDRWILSRLQRTIQRVTASLDECLFNDAANALYDFLWHDVCDWYLEIAKVQLAQTADSRQQTADLLVYVLEASLRLLHPIMPFVTEELWQHLWDGGQGRSVPANAPHSIMVAEWPKVNRKLIDEEAEALFEQFKAVVGAIRNTRAELNVPNDRKTPVVLLISKNPSIRCFLDKHKALLQTLAVSTAAVLKPEEFKIQKDAIVAIVSNVEVVIPLGGFMDDKARQRLQQRVEELTKHLAQTDARLQDPQFTDKAPADIVEQNKQRRQELQETLTRFSNYLAALQST